MPDPEDREIIREPHPEVVRWLDTLCPWPADKPFPLTPLETWYVVQGYTVAPAAQITLEDMLQMPDKLEGGDGGIMLWNP